MGTERRKRLVIGGIASLLFASTPVIVSAAADSSTSTVSATVSSVISISTPGTVAISVTPTSNGMFSSASDTVTVSTNNTTGYNLKLANSDATTSLSDGAGHTIAASSNPMASAATLASGTWGFALASGTQGIGSNNFDASYSPVTNGTGVTSKWAGVPASGSGVTIKSTSANATGDTTNVYYAVKIDTTQPTGTYSDTVTYTALTN